MLFPRFVVAGTQSGVGKTTLALALMAALSRQGLLVQPFKIGPDYIDPSFHHLAAGKESCNLDAWLVPEDGLRTLFLRHAPAEPLARPSGNAPAGISILEGVMGLYDGHGTGPRASTAHLASILKAPVVLMVNARGMSLSAAAMVSGFVNFSGQKTLGKAPYVELDDLRVKGIVLNHVSGERHYALLKECIESNTGIPCLGYLPKGAVLSLPERHLGLVPAGEMDELAAFFDVLAGQAEATLDIPAFLDLACKVPELEPPATLTENICAKRFSDLTIGIPRDEAFSFYYPENLELLENMGARLVYFSALRDCFLPPDLDGLYMGGGFPEMFAEALEANASFLRSLTDALEAGLPAYAECGAMLYLCSRLDTQSCTDGLWNGREGKQNYTLAGFFHEQAEMSARLQPFGYVTVTLLRDCPLGKKGTRYRAHEYHYARITESGGDPLFLVEKEDGRSWTGGLHKKNVAAGFPHLHFYGCPEIAASFLDTCRRHKADKEIPA